VQERKFKKEHTARKDEEESIQESKKQRFTKHSLSGSVGILTNTE